MLTSASLGAGVQGRPRWLRCSFLLVVGVALVLTACGAKEHSARTVNDAGNDFQLAVDRAINSQTFAFKESLVRRHENGSDVAATTQGEVASPSLVQLQRLDEGGIAQEEVIVDGADMYQRQLPNGEWAVQHLPGPAVRVNPTEVLVAAKPAVVSSRVGDQYSFRLPDDAAKRFMGVNDQSDATVTGSAKITSGTLEEISFVGVTGPMKLNISLVLRDLGSPVTVTVPT